jgi:hypothetical protein
MLVLVSLFMLLLPYPGMFCVATVKFSLPGGKFVVFFREQLLEII